ncbi:MAG TPA: glutaminyl-peptide cyclotransferase [Candidatus Binatia bacterium]|nr:glutaminyl-peptide cyclotransferase [Candidatus Binatia bacterium]
MNRFTLAAVLVVLAVLVVIGIGVILLNIGQTPANSSFPTLYTYQVVKSYPHDTSAFTEGLVFDNGALYESTGGYGSSSLRLDNLEDGTVRQKFLLPSQYFGEGLTIANGALIQLTWQENTGFIYDKEKFGLRGNFSYSTQGWGLTYNGSELIMSDGTSNLYFLDPITYQKVGQVNVHDGNTPVTNINELEYIKGDVYANIWLTQKIAIINPKTGAVKGWIDMIGLYQSDDSNVVLNGIAYDQKTERLFVTGKDWPNIYQITISPKTQ